MRLLTAWRSGAISVTRSCSVISRTSIRGCTPNLRKVAASLFLPQGYAAHQGVGTDIHEQAALRPHGRPVPQGRGNADQLKVWKDVLAARHRQQGFRGVQGRIFRASYQCFMGKDGASSEVAEGLENAMQFSCADESSEGPCAVAHGGGEPSRRGCVVWGLEMAWRCGR